MTQLVNLHDFDCNCGKKHESGVSYLKIGPGAVDSVPEALEKLGKRHPLVVCGPNGYEAAGRRVCSILAKSGIDGTLRIIPEDGGKPIRPGERAVGDLVMRYDPNRDAILGVGSGVINDICKVMGTAAGVPCMIVATAPSMDGYASDSASVENHGIKYSLTKQAPASIVCDTDILAAAPMKMICAGLGDILAKYTSLCDWRISQIVTGEYYCEEVAELVRHSLRQAVEAAPGIPERSAEAVRKISEGLVLSGLAIAYAGCSHPASGLEHYFSHCWDMTALECGREHELHGIQVAVGTVLTLRIVEKLKTLRPDMARAEAAADAFERQAWERNILRVFPKSGPELLELELRAGKNQRDGRLRRAQKIIESWDSILNVFDEELPKRGEVEALMRGVGLPVTPQEIGLTERDVLDAFICSRDIRDKYLLSSMIWDIGYMGEAAGWLK